MKYTVVTAFTQIWTQTVTVDAETIEHACEIALKTDQDDFNPEEYFGDPFVQAVGQGDNAYNGVRSAFPVPKDYQA